MVVDDGSNADVKGTLAGLSLVRVLRKPNLGVNAAGNHGLRECRANWVLTFDDDDDVLLHGALAVRTALATLSEAEQYPVVLFASSNSRQEASFARLNLADYLEGRVGGDLTTVILFRRVRNRI